MPQSNTSTNHSLPDLYLISSYQLPTGLQTCSRVSQSVPSTLKQNGECFFYLTNLEQVFYHLEDKTRFVYHAVIPNRLNTRYIEDGHHDGASSFSFYEGLASPTITVLEEYNLTKSGDIKALINKGLFGPAGGLMSNSNPENYAMWCITNNQIPLLEQFITDAKELYHIINNVIYSKHSHLGERLAKRLNIEPLLDMEVGFLIENAANKKQFEIINILRPKLMQYINQMPQQEFDKIISILGTCGDITNFTALIKAKPIRLNVLKEMIIKLCNARQFNLITSTYEQFEKSVQLPPKNNLQIWCEIVQWLAVYQQNELLQTVLNKIQNHLTDTNKAHLADLALSTENSVLKSLSSDWLAITPINTEELNLDDACKQGRYRRIQALIEQGADIHANSNEALHNCCEFGFVGAARLLLDKGADVNAWMYRAIKLANKYQFADLKQLLLYSGSEDKYFK